jgi:hypothetical protein
VATARIQATAQYALEGQDVCDYSSYQNTDMICTHYLLQMPKLSKLSSTQNKLPTDSCSSSSTRCTTPQPKTSKARILDLSIVVAYFTTTKSRKRLLGRSRTKSGKSGGRKVKWSQRFFQRGNGGTQRHTTSFIWIRIQVATSVQASKFD